MKGLFKKSKGGCTGGLRCKYCFPPSGTKYGAFVRRILKREAKKHFHDNITKLSKGE